MKILFSFFLLCFTGLLQAQNEVYVVQAIHVDGKYLTKDDIILREIPFSAGDTVFCRDTAALAENAEQNLVNTSLFHRAEVLFTDSGLVWVRVTERWYIWPVPFFSVEERNFNVWLRDPDLEKATYGLYVYHENFRGRKEYLKLLCKTGYNELYGFSYSKPYIDKRKNTGISAAAGFEGSHALSVTVIEQEPKTIKLIDRYAFSGLFGSLSLTRRQGIHLFHKLSILFESTSFADTLIQAYPDYAPGTDWTRLSLNYQFRADFRDFKPYPLKGWYADLEFSLGNFLSLSDLNEKKYYLKSTSRKYLRIRGPFYAATGFTGLLTLSSPEKMVSSPALGYGSDFVRGYQYQVIPVDHFLIHRSNLKFSLLKQRIVRLPLIRSEKFRSVPVAFFVNAFFDQGWSAAGKFAILNPMSGDYLAGYGVGLDFVTYYDKVFRLEFTVNRLMQKGLFLHFTAPV